MILHGRTIAPGTMHIVEGSLLVTSMGISFFGGVDPESGVIVERGHELEGQSIAGKILVFPSGKGSTVGSYTLYRLKYNGMAPLAILNAECETITAVGCIIAEIACLDQLPLAALKNGQRAWVDGRAGLCMPLPQPLCGLDGSFTAHTIQKRLPEIAQRVRQETVWPSSIAASLQALSDDLPDGLLRPLLDWRAADAADWEAGMAAWFGKSWMEAAWLPAEMYFFRRILEATGYFLPGEGQAVDPYLPQKKLGLKQVVEALRPFCTQAPGGERGGNVQNLARLMHLGMWGNQADLSMWPAAGSKKPSHSALGPGAVQEALTEQILRDDSRAAAEKLLAKAPDSKVAFILDNGGVELGFDLLLTDYLLSQEIARQVTFYARPFPTYVSDVILPDLEEMLEWLAKAGDAGVRALAQRMRAYQRDGRWTSKDDFFFASPLAGWQMPPDLFTDLADYDLMISKGDANYRRWLGDLHWAPDAPLEEILSYLPTSWLALRVLKSEVIAGLRPGQAEANQQTDPHWMYNGGRGVIQYVEK